MNFVRGELWNERSNYDVENNFLSDGNRLIIWYAFLERTLRVEEF